MARAISAENVSKAYRLGETGTGTVLTDVRRWYTGIAGKKRSFWQTGETHTRGAGSTKDIVWSLKDISFEFEQGSATGIVGRNGAGKSTLLKILSRITSPSTGSIKLKGRVAALLEVGTGFHPELTGRENVFLNGAILGMRKKEIRQKFDEIVDFAGVERYIDTPVKRYSSGMYVRLAFAVAAHLESEILIVDEVLAVGDAEFQNKCMGKMQDVNRGEGRTIIFVSHNMEAIESLTENAMYLKHGRIESIGKTGGVVNTYLNDHEQVNKLPGRAARAGDGRAKIVKVGLCKDGREITSVKQGEAFDVLIGVDSREALQIDMSYVLENAKEQALFSTHLSDCRPVQVRTGYYEVIIHINVPYLRKGEYFFSMSLFSPGQRELYDEIKHFPAVTVDGADSNNEFPQDARFGSLYYPVQWKEYESSVTQP